MPKSADYGKKLSSRKEPLASLIKFIAACRLAEEEDREVCGKLSCSAGEIVFGFVSRNGKRTKTDAAKLLDDLLVEAKKWGL